MSPRSSATGASDGTADWSRRFDDPIDLPDGRIINTIGEAAEYALDLPSKIGSTPPWQRAADALRKAAEHGGPFVFMARISFYCVVYGERPPALGKSEGRKEHRWRSSRKLARNR